MIDMLKAKELADAIDKHGAVYIIETGRHAFPNADDMIVAALRAYVDDAEQQLLFVYESILTEMRRSAPYSETITEWVRRLDFARDEAKRHAASLTCPECGHGNRLNGKLIHAGNCSRHGD